MHAQDGGLWGVDDGRAEQGAKHATVADGEGASIHIFNSNLIVASLRHTTHTGSHLRYKFNSDWFNLKLHSKKDKYLGKLLPKVVYLFSQCINGFLNVSKVHGLNVTDHRYNKPLNKHKLFRCIRC